MSTPLAPTNGFEPRALIFDCDGTLADTMPTHFRAWSEACALHGLTLSEERFYALGGVPAVKIFALLAEEAGIELDCEAAAHEKEELFMRSLEDLQPIEPVVAIAAEYRGKLPMAVATGGMRKVIEPMLEQLGLTDWFDTLVAAEDVEHGKPAPDTYLLAAERLGVASEHCRAYEDAEAGLASARAAGMDVVDIRELVKAAAKA